ncbi:hypothetical protein CHUAL_001588 [Chamberlinius hualienensis]
MNVIIVSLLLSMSAAQLDVKCVNHTECKNNTYCLDTRCEACIDCQQKFNRESKQENNCSKSITDCGTCISGYKEVDNGTFQACSQQSENENIVNEDDYSVRGWIVFGFGILGALVGFILGTAATVAMAFWQKRRRRRNQANNKQWRYDYISTKRNAELSTISHSAKTETLNSASDENGLLSDSNDEAIPPNYSYNRSTPNKNVSTFQSLIHSKR